MLVRKLVVEKLEVGSLYVAYSAKSKMLSSNGNKGVFVLVEKVMGKDVKVFIPSIDKSMVLKRLNERQDAWMYLPDDSLKLLVKGAEKAALFPKFTQRMNDAFEGKEIKFIPDALYKHEREGEGNGQHFYRFRGEDEKMNTFNFAWIAPNVAPEWRIPRAQRMGVGAVEVALPPKPASAEEKALIESLSAAINTFNEKKRLDRTASFCLVNAEGKITDEHYSAACHYGLKENKGQPYILSGVRKKGDNVVKKALHLKYITYLTTISPFKDAFLVKDAEWIFDNCYVLSGNVSAQLLCGACIATRQAWEYPHFVETWMLLAEQGIELNTAYLFGCFSMTHKDGKMSFGAGSTGHTVFALNRMADEQLINFIDGKIVEQNEESYIKDKDYNGVNRLWGDNNNQASVFHKLRNIGGVGKYGSATPIAIEDAIEQAADIIETWQRETGV